MNQPVKSRVHELRGMNIPALQQCGYGLPPRAIIRPILARDATGAPQARDLEGI